MHLYQCIWHRPRCMKIYSVRKDAGARVQNFYTHEHFCDYSRCIVPSGKRLVYCALGVCVCVCVCVRERERETETERDGSDATIVALKLAMSLHFPCKKNSHFSFLPSQLVTIVALKFAISSHFPLPKKSASLFWLFQMARRVIEDPRQRSTMPAPP